MMKNDHTSKPRKLAALILTLFMWQIFLPVAGDVSTTWAAEIQAENLEIEPPRKSEMFMDDIDISDASKRKANVLFYLDTSTPMIFSPKGILPHVEVLKSNGKEADWRATAKARGMPEADWEKARKQNIDLMAECTFGPSSLPIASSRNTTNISRNNPFGREVDLSNNFEPGMTLDDVDFKNRYYAPFRDSTVPIGGYDRSLLYWLRKYTKGATGADYIGAYSVAKNFTSFPYAMVFRDPRHWAGWKGPGDPTSADLVPNDSRLYQMKLVFWRLLTEEQSLFENIRFGMVTAFSGPKVGTLKRILQQKVSSFGRHTGSSAPFEHGLLAHYQTGQHKDHNMNHSQKTSWSVPLFTFRGELTPQLNALRNFIERGYLRLPIAEYSREWKRGDLKISHADKFKMWIDGFEDVNPDVANSFYRHRNPELRVSGNTPLAMSIFQHPKDSDRDREWYVKNGGVHFSYTTDKNFNPNEIINGEVVSDDADESEEPGEGEVPDDVPVSDDEEIDISNLTPSFNTLRHYYKGDSGEAAGSVIDFFSPPVLPQDGPRHNILDPDKMSDISFPITDVCEPNWLVLFTSGVETADDDDYKAVDAIKNLYDFTDKSKDHYANGIAKPEMNITVRSGDGGKRELHRGKLEYPIQTLVIGMVPDVKDGKTDAERDNIKILRKNIYLMALAGQGMFDKPGYSLNALRNADYDTVKASVERAIREHGMTEPGFAGNVPQLITAFRKALMTIDDDRLRPEKGSMLEGAALGDEDENGIFNLFSASYKIMANDQWQGDISRFESIKDEKGAVVIKERWSLAKSLINNRKETFDENRRNLRYWNGGNFAKVTDGNTDLEKLTGMDEVLPPAAPSDVDYSSSKGYLTPFQALVRWLHGFDYSYKEGEGGKLFLRGSMLADFGQSGIVVMKPPTIVNSLPGYREWARSDRMRGIDTMLYAQTNDGVLHTMDAKKDSSTSQVEHMAILPPPVLLPSRLTALKSEFAAGKRYWIDVHGDDGDDYKGSRSTPRFVLDGPLQLRPIDSENNGNPDDFDMYLLATLGRAGAGMYMLKVSDPKKPEFLWYRETLNEGKNISLLEMEGKFGMTKPKVSPMSTDWGQFVADDIADYRQLGFNFPKPAMGVAGYAYGDRQNIMVVAGGAQSSLDLSMNGTEGAALYIADPLDGEIKRMFNGASNFETKPPVASSNFGAEPYMGMMVSEPTLERATNSKYITGRIHAADDRGSIFSVFLEDKLGVPIENVNNWPIYTIASLKKDTHDKGTYSNPYGIALGKKGLLTWAAGGTANISTGDGNELINAEHMIFAFNMPSIAEVENIGFETMTRGKNWKQVKSDDLFDIDEDLDKKGWYIPLEKATDKYDAEYVSAKPVIMNGKLYCTTFRRNKFPMKIKDDDLCAPRYYSGETCIFEMDVDTAKGSWSESKRAVVIEGVKVTGLTVSEQGSKTTVLATFAILDRDTALESIANLIEQEGTKVAKMTDGKEIIGLSLTTDLAGKDTKLGGKSVINYWMEKEEQ